MPPRLNLPVKQSVMNGNNNPSNLDNLSGTVKEYINLKADEIKLKGVENFSILSNKMLVFVVVTMLLAVILQLCGFAFAFFIGEIVGSTAIGFIIMAALFACILGIIYAKRETLFLNRMVRMYVKLFFGNSNNTQQ